MAIESFIPNVWSGKLLLELKKSLVYGSEGIINTDYEGEIVKAGDSVKILNFGPISIFDYTKNDDMPGPETLSEEELTLMISESKGFNFQIDDIDKVQSMPDVMGAAMGDAAYRLADVCDKYIASMYDDFGIQVGDVSPIKLTASNVYDNIVDLATLLSEHDVPKNERFLVVPPWVYGLLLKDSRFLSAGYSDNTLYNGVVGKVCGFTVYESNNVPVDGKDFKIMAGHKSGWSFANQINQMEAYRPEKRFGDACKGLHLYGAKVVRPNSLACLTAMK